MGRTRALLNLVKHHKKKCVFPGYRTRGARELCEYSSTALDHWRGEVRVTIIRSWICRENPSWRNNPGEFVHQQRRHDERQRTLNVYIINSRLDKVQSSKNCDNFAFILTSIVPASLLHQRMSREEALGRLRGRGEVVRPSFQGWALRLARAGFVAMLLVRSLRSGSLVSAVWGRIQARRRLKRYVVWGGLQARRRLKGYGFILLRYFSPEQSIRCGSCVDSSRECRKTTPCTVRG